MVLFVKRTSAIKVSSTSRIDQGNGGGGGKMEEKQALVKSQGLVLVPWGWAVFEHLRDTHQRPFISSSTVNPGSLGSLNRGQLQS